MILVDLNQVILSSLHVALGGQAQVELEPFRNMVVNTLRRNNHQFRGEYGAMVLVNDSRNYWRKQYFPFYKIRRKERRAKSKQDWKQIYACLDLILEEIEDAFPYKYICVDGAEADDCIAVLCDHVKDEPILILSGDRDFMQLHSDRIKQYDPVNKDYLFTPNAKTYLFDKILSGDAGDDIPSVLCPQDHYATKGKRRVLTQKRRDALQNIASEPANEFYANFTRNRMLIDLSYTPIEIRDRIVKEYDKPFNRTRSEFQLYLRENGMIDQLQALGQF